MEIKNNEKLNKFINFIKPEKDVIILFLIGFVICYVFPLMMLCPKALEDFWEDIEVASELALNLFAPAICLFVFNKIILFQHSEKVIKYLIITTKVLYIIFTFYFLYWLLFFIVIFLAVQVFEFGVE